MGDDFDFIINEYGSGPSYEPTLLSSEHLPSKIKKLIDLGMMYVMEDIIDLTGTTFLFTIPFCAN
jgi:hypothetical protein